MSLEEQFNSLVNLIEPIAGLPLTDEEKAASYNECVYIGVVPNKPDLFVFLDPLCLHKHPQDN